MPPSVTFVPPGINHQENKNEKSQHEENYGPGLGFPELLHCPGELGDIHSLSRYTTPA
jgi:hypothetical protein